MNQWTTACFMGFGILFALDTLEPVLPGDCELQHCCRADAKTHKENTE